MEQLKTNFQAKILLLQDKMYFKNLQLLNILIKLNNLEILVKLKIEIKINVKHHLGHYCTMILSKMKNIMKIMRDLKVV